MTDRGVRTGMAYMQRKSPHDGDWCHLCGGRSDTNVEIWYPSNAEHQSQDRPHQGAHRENGFLRICAACGEDIRRCGSGEVQELVVDRPGMYPKKDCMKPRPGTAAEAR